MELIAYPKKNMKNKSQHRICEFIKANFVLFHRPPRPLMPWDDQSQVVLNAGRCAVDGTVRGKVMAHRNIEIEILKESRAQQKQIGLRQHFADAAVLAQCERVVLVGNRQLSVLQEVFRIEGERILNDFAVLHHTGEHRNDHCVSRDGIAAQSRVTKSAMGDAKGVAHESSQRFLNDCFAVRHAAKLEVIEMFHLGMSTYLTRSSNFGSRLRPITRSISSRAFR